MAYTITGESDTTNQLVTEAGAEKTTLLAAKVKLFKSSFVPTPASVTADFAAAEADFVGYAASTIVWDTVGVRADGVVEYQGSGPAFTATDGTTPNSIGGAWLELATAGTDPVSYYAFAVLINITTALAQIAYTITRRFGAAGDMVTQN